MTSKDFLKELSVFMSLYFLFFFAGMGSLAIYGKDELQLTINSNHYYFLDEFFKYYTDYAVDFVLISLIIYTFWKKTFYDFLLLIIPFLVMSLLLFLIRTFFFHETLRPVPYFELQGIDLHLIEGVDINSIYTFPSGHTMNAFMFYPFLGLLIKNKKWQVLFFILAFLVAYSRVYLSKHFVFDTLGGSLLGITSMIYMFYFLNSKYNSWTFLKENPLKFTKRRFNKNL